MTYRCIKTTDLGTRIRAEKGSIIETIDTKYRVENGGVRTQFKLISGKFKTIVHSSFWQETTKDYSGGGPFLTIEELSDKLGCDINSLYMQYDPCGRFEQEYFKNIKG